MTRRALTPREDDLHAAVADALRLAIGPEGVTSLDGAFWTSRELRTASKSEGADRKRRGCAPGMPDIDISFPMQGEFISAAPLYQHGIELKTPHGRVSEVQSERYPHLVRAGWRLAVCRSVDDVLRQLIVWRVPHRRVRA